WVTLTSGTLTFNQLQLTPTLSGSGKTYTFGSGALTLNSNFDINPTAASALALTVNVGANITVAASATTTITGSGAGPATSILDVKPAATYYPFSTGHLVLGDNGTFDAAGVVEFSGFYALTLRGTAGTLLTRSGTGAFIAGSSTVSAASDSDVTL